MEHTPGPWKVYRNWQGKLSVAADDGRRRICNTPGGNNANPDLQAEGLANARLIAAAPDLLDALQAVSKCGNAGAKLSRDASDKVRSAIKRATEG